MQEPEILLHLQDIADMKQEHFISFSLDAAGRLIAKHTVFIGTLTGMMVHPREVFALAITDRAASIILAHNHPSGESTPSEADIETTQQFEAAGQILGIRLHDHFIVAANGHYSFRADGQIYRGKYPEAKEVLT
jgi:DNA repair protein RadC